MFLTIIFILSMIRGGNTENNVLLDFALTAEPNITKIAFFYNVDRDLRIIPLNHTNLNKISSYLTIGVGMNPGSYVKYFKEPNFRQPDRLKYFDKNWLGALCMDKLTLEKWVNYSLDIGKSPTFVWKVISGFCFQNRSNILLYDYSVIIPSVVPANYMYVFTWTEKSKYKNIECTQSTYSLTHDQIDCYAVHGIDCFPPFTTL
jgi:hypothetical protein